MFTRKPSPKTIISILALILALAVVSGCGSSSSSKSAGAAPTAVSEQRGDEVVEQHERGVHLPTRPRQDFVTSCVHHLRATRSLCVCFHERVEAHTTDAEIAALEVDMRENVPLPAALVGYVEECPN
jgi:hypothetical protein